MKFSVRHIANVEIGILNVNISVKDAFRKVNWDGEVKTSEFQVGKMIADAMQ